jgi:hypothetical protein
MLLQGRSQSCMFTGACSDLFTHVAMLHLCSADSDQSLPARMFSKLLGELNVRVDMSDATPSASEFQRSTSSDSTDTRTTPLSTSPLLQSLEDADRRLPDELTATPQSKGDVIAALQQRIRGLEDALASEAASKATPDTASPSGTPYRTAAASLIQNGVPVIPASTVDLDLSHKILLGRGVYSEVRPTPSHTSFLAHPACRETRAPFKLSLPPYTPLPPAPLGGSATTPLTRACEWPAPQVYQTTMAVAVKALTGRFSQQRLQLFRREAEALQLVQARPAPSAQQQGEVC